nr:DUF983 domain-containing protein [Polymorphobacter sp.]
MPLADPPVSAVAAALKGRCPRCGKGLLFTRVIVFVPRCSSCGLDVQGFNVGDGAASFLILIVGAIVTGLAMWLELTRSPPWYVHVALWLPLTLGLTLALMRVAKAILLALEYRHEARQGRL